MKEDGDSTKNINSKDFNKDEFKRILKTGDKSAEDNEPTENNKPANELAENDYSSKNNYSNEEYEFSKNMLNL